MKGDFEKQVISVAAAGYVATTGAAVSYSRKRSCGGANVENLSRNERTQKEVQQMTVMTADGQDCRPSLPWEEEKDGEVK
jgi:hypothetical protein